MQGFTEGLMTSSIIRNKTEERRAAFRAANASLALEGLIADQRDHAMQEEVIQGRLTTEQAIAQCVMECGIDQMNKTTALASTSVLR